MPWLPGFASSVPFAAAADEDEFAESTVGVVISGEFNSGVTVEPVAVIVDVAILNAVDSRLMDINWKFICHDIPLQNKFILMKILPLVKRSVILLGGWCHLMKTDCRTNDERD